MFLRSTSSYNVAQCNRKLVWRDLNLAYSGKIRVVYECLNLLRSCSQPPELCVAQTFFIKFTEFYESNLHQRTCICHQKAIWWNCGHIDWTAVRLGALICHDIFAFKLPLFVRHNFLGCLWSIRLVWKQPRVAITAEVDFKGKELRLYGVFLRIFDNFCPCEVFAKVIDLDIKLIQHNQILTSCKNSDRYSWR